ncbi:MAG TPA: peptidylprolyl isomerase [Saprospiraceae bacterium]|nr:peptidylprolyl isomerase [Saprospiraceae bacterium]
MKLLLPLLILLIGCAVPKVGFEAPSGQFMAPASVQFRNTSQNADAYVWDFGDGHSSEESSPIHRYTRSGDYMVTLRATKGNAIKEHQKTITVTAPETCLIEIQTKFGNMTLKLSDETPLHRDNFIKLAEEGYYDGLLFHRVINGFMIQGGDPNSRNAAPGQQLGAGGPSYQVPAEFVDDLIHIKGAIAAARTGDSVNPKKMSSGSQFYIVHGKPITEQELTMMESRKGIHYTSAQREVFLKHGGTPFLDRDYTVFGQVIEGLDVIDKIASVATDRGDRPTEDVTMKVIVIK